MAYVFVLGVMTTSAQTLNPPPRDVIRQPRVLLGAEIAAVLDAARHAIDGRTFRLSYQPDGPGPEFLMGPDGTPRVLRATSGTTGQADTLTITHYTGSPAVACNGSPRDGELVVEYESRRGSNWMVTARTRTAFEINQQAFDMLAGRVSVASGPLERVGDRTLRRFTANYTLPKGASGGPPPGTVMSLWIDADSLLPVRWSLKTPTDLPELIMPFTYLENADVRPPAGVQSPTCVP